MLNLKFLSQDKVQIRRFILQDKASDVYTYEMVALCR